MRFKFAYLRFTVQVASLFLLNGLILNFLFPNLNLQRSLITIPVLSSINGSMTMIFGSLDMIQISLSNARFPLITIGLVIVIGAVAGRIMCGWICPVGFIQDLVTKLKGHVGQVALRTHNQAIKLKFLILATILLVSGTLAASIHLGSGAEYKAALGALASGPFLAISPDGTIFGTLPRLLQTVFGLPSASQRADMLEAASLQVGLISPLLALKLFVVAGFLYGAWKVPRFWCRYLCPVGAMMGIFGKVSFLGVKRDLVKCQKCPHCEVSCPTQIKILDLSWQKFNSAECILCMECVDSCPERALSPKFP